jgi:hypothetical protein
VAAAVDLRLDAHARLAPHVQRADALGAVGLVRRQRHQVDRQRRQVDRHLAGGLRRVHVQQHALGAAEAPMAAMSWITPISLFTNITDTSTVSGRSAAANVVQVEQAVGLHVQHGDLEAFALQFAHRVEHRLVLGLQRDQVPALGLVETALRP